MEQCNLLSVSLDNGSYECNIIDGNKTCFAATGKSFKCKTFAVNN